MDDNLLSKGCGLDSAFSGEKRKRPIQDSLANRNEPETWLDQGNAAAQDDAPRCKQSDHMRQCFTNRVGRLSQDLDRRGIPN